MTNTTDHDQEIKLDACLAALADRQRRDLVRMLQDGPQSVSALAQTLPISRPAVSQHLKVLLDARLVDVTAVGTRRYYRLSPDGLTDMRAWLDTLWTDALAAYAAAAQAEKDKT